MNTKKYIVLCIIFSLLIPCKIILGQNMESDTAVQSELDIKYDSILAKAASALTASAYQQSIDYYKEASALKPGETYAYKMINYVQDLAVKQKRADDLKRKAQIKNDLTKANQAIADRKWDSAKILFNEVLALKPEKADEDFAKSKVEAINLELQRIAARMPVKEEPKPVYVPKNRQEARAMRKLAERNAMLAAAADKKLAAQAVTPSANNVAVTTNAPKTNAIAQKPLQSSTFPVTKVSPPAARETPKNTGQVTLPQKKVVSADSLTHKAIQQKPIQTSVQPKTEPVATFPAKQVTQKPAQVASTTNQTVALPPAKVMPQRPAETPASARNNAVAPAAPAVKETQQTPLPTNNRAVAAPPAARVTQPAPLPVNNRTVAAPPAAKETQQRAAQALSPASSNASLPNTSKEIQSKPAQAATLPDNTITTSSREETPPRTKEGNLSKLSDSSDYVKLICQDISFIGSNAYIKVLIQNYSPTTEFLTDTLHVSIKKPNGIVKELDQRFISNFPIIMPLKESVLVSFADAAMKVAPDDIFIVEMHDKMRKTKLSLQVPWSVYNQQKSF